MFQLIFNKSYNIICIICLIQLITHPWWKTTLLSLSKEASFDHCACAAHMPSPWLPFCSPVFLPTCVRQMRGGRLYLLLAAAVSTLGPPSCPHAAQGRGSAAELHGDRERLDGHSSLLGAQVRDENRHTPNTWSHCTQVPSVQMKKSKITCKLTWSCMSEGRWKWKLNSVTISYYKLQPCTQITHLRNLENYCKENVVEARLRKRKWQELN